MSQHRYTTTHSDGRRIEVMMGYDRRLDYVFMTVFDLDSEDEDILYCNLDDDEAGLTCQNVDYFRRILHRLVIHVPESMFIETTRDQHACVGNREVDHTPAGSPQ